MIIRQLDLADIPAVAALLRRAALDFILPESTPEGAEQFLIDHGEAGLRARLSEGFVYHVAIVDGELAGFIGVRERSHVFHLFVDRRWHRRGIARRLWETGRDAALGAGHPGVFTVNASNHAVSFYESLGFVRTAPMQVARVLYNPMRIELDPRPDSRLRAPA
jgi:ribosomal protein S18 acetylase RimI-like enzyme